MRSDLQKTPSSVEIKHDIAIMSVSGKLDHFFDNRLLGLGFSDLEFLVKPRMMIGSLKGRREFEIVLMIRRSRVVLCDGTFVKMSLIDIVMVIRGGIERVRGETFQRACRRPRNVDSGGCLPTNWAEDFVMTTQLRSARFRGIGRMSGATDGQAQGAVRLGRLIQVALALYLIPVLLIVLVVGGIGMLVLAVARRSQRSCTGRAVGLALRSDEEPSRLNSTSSWRRPSRR